MGAQRAAAKFNDAQRALALLIDWTEHPGGTPSHRSERRVFAGARSRGDQVSGSRGSVCGISRSAFERGLLHIVGEPPSRVRAPGSRSLWCRISPCHGNQNIDRGRHRPRPQSRPRCEECTTPRGRARPTKPHSSGSVPGAGTAPSGFTGSVAGGAIGIPASSPGVPWRCRCPVAAVSSPIT